MWRNEGTIDRIARVIIGVILLGAGVLSGVSGALTWVLIIVGALGIVTGAVGWCCLYAVFGWSTNKAAKADQTPTA